MVKNRKELNMTKVLTHGFNQEIIDVIAKFNIFPYSAIDYSTSPAFYFDTDKYLMHTKELNTFKHGTPNYKEITLGFILGYDPFSLDNSKIEEVNNSFREYYRNNYAKS